MRPSIPLKEPVKVGELVRRRLHELNRSPRELAEAVHVPAEYIEELISGRRRPPRPGRTDLYDRMTRFLQLSRNDLAFCARAERHASEGGTARASSAVRLLLGLCNPETAKAIERRSAEHGRAEVDDLAQRVLDVAQGGVMRLLQDEIALRVAATQRGLSYAALRLKILEFLDASPATFTAEHYQEFVQPRIAMWDVDLEAGVLRVVLQGQSADDRRRPAPAAGRPRRQAAG